MKKNLFILFFAIVIIFFGKTYFFDNPSKVRDLFLSKDSKFKLGKEIFLHKGKCASCHTLSDANSYAETGPNLDKIIPDKLRVVKATSEGVGVMPSSLLEGILNKDEIEAVAEYVSKATKK
jgi:mono/diheme cytochrome c family protein